MKLLLTIWASLWLTTLSAQETHAGTDTLRIENKAINILQDSISMGHSYTQINPATFLSKVQSHKQNLSANVAIPTVRLDTSIHYATPIKKLSGENLAPMPGTDSLSNYALRPKIIIRTTPPTK